MKLKIPTLTKKKTIALISLVLVFVLILFWILSSCSSGKGAKLEAEYEAYTVERGEIAVSVTGSGTVQPNEQFEIQSIVTGEILEDYVTLGATVNKDDILYIIDSSSAQNSIERQEASYEQQVISYNNKLNQHNEDTANRSVRAPVSGYISELYVKEGDSVSNGTKLAEIKNSEYIKVRIPFLSSNAKNIYANQSATVYLEERNEEIRGYVSHVATGTYATESGAIVSDIEITFKNPGAVLPGESVTAIVGSYACNDYGEVENSDIEIITAKVSGKVENLSYSRGDNITNGSLLLNIYDSNQNSDMRSSELSLKNAKLSLDDLMEKLDDYTLTSPITGTIISKTMKGGDTLDGNKSSLAIVADMSKLTFEMSVDELYIKDVSVGQTVKITADALPNAEFEGIVDTVSIIGTSSSGVTVYPITVVISEYEGLLPGMNVNAEIMISNAEDVLVIPQNAVSRGNLVLVKDDGKASEEEKANEDKGNDKGKNNKDKNVIRMPEAPDGYKYVKVATGEANDDYIEITSGLSEGDIIYIPVLKNTSQAEAGFAGFGGMGSGMPSRMPSGMPSGGMPSGGMPSGGTGRSGIPSGGGMR